ncbi:PRC-barrel domain containing protein [Halomonas sp. C05BenzN]|uniref:PRC-barrel domain containing protein n=1 Tax=Halomonas sp. C05BenzN TaxID=3411041 RepID=UPI003B94E4BD
MRKTTLALSLSLAAGGLGMAAQADEVRDPGIQGLYSADALLDADAYLMSDPDERIGDVEDVLLDDDMQVQALVIESGATLGLGGREIVLDNEHYRLDARTEEDGEPVYRLLVDASAEELGELPEYDRDWWEQARQNAAEAWESTREGAQSAWQRTRDAVSGD